MDHFTLYHAVQSGRLAELFRNDVLIIVIVRIHKKCTGVTLTYIYYIYMYGEHVIYDDSELVFVIVV